jgi:CBS domain-containing protein
MKVGEIMTRKVISVPPDTPVMAVARLLADRGFSAVPVTDNWGMLLGIVSEADLIRRLATEDPPERRGLLSALFYDREGAALRYARAHGATARDIMTTEVITATESMTAEHAARLLDEHKVRRLPVVHDGVLVGIVSRADLLRALLAPAKDTSDAAIRAAVQAEMARLPWADAPYVFFDVQDGEVTLHGYCNSPAVRKGLVAIASRVPGVKAVHDEIVEGPVAAGI